MTWADNREKIRRFLRDPDGNIWTDAFLLRGFNDAQHDFFNVVGLLQKVDTVRVPPFYSFSYTHDFEWHTIDGEKSYRCLKYHHQGEINICCFDWEIEQLGYSTGSGTDTGHAFTHPWEAWAVTNVNRPIPTWFPEDFNNALLVAWDKEPIIATTKKLVQSTDQSWRNHSGQPQAYFREDVESNEFYIYPRPDTTWKDIDDSGMVLFDDEADDELGTIVDADEARTTADDGAAFDVVEDDENILLVYNAQPTDIETDFDESQYPGYMQKYIEYASLEQAYSANTDGRISTLRDYWQWRKELGLEFVKRYKWKRLEDRDFRLVSHDTVTRRHYRGPRLPDEYPDVK